MPKSPRAAKAPKQDTVGNEASAPIAPAPVAAAEVAGAESGAQVAAPEEPSVESAAEGPIFADTPAEQPQGGSGDQAVREPTAAELEQTEQFEKQMADAQAAFRKQFPHFGAAVDKFVAANPDVVPVALRVKSKPDHFRRAGIAFSRQPVDLPIDQLSGLVQIEALLSEPNLVVEII